MAKKDQVNIGRGLDKEKSSTNDRHDPFAGGFGVRGATLTGTVVGTKAAKTATIKMTKKILIPKYNRYTSRTYKIQAHNPESIDAKDGDLVKVMETRPISKTKHFCVVEIIKRDEA
jgi:small subunit ribosomal protein S17